MKVVDTHAGILTLADMSCKRLIAAIVLCVLLPSAAGARTIYKCWRHGSPSIATLPEPGSRCTAEHFQDGPKMSNAWQELGLLSGTLYARPQGRGTLYSTRQLPGAKPLFRFVVRDDNGRILHHPNMHPPRSNAPFVPSARVGVFDRQFKEAARHYEIEEAWLRAVAHAESGYVTTAVSPKGAMGVMQLMPETASQYGVKDPFAAPQSINAGARHLAYLLRLYSGDKTRAAAAYNAGEDAVQRYRGVPPYDETQEYVRRVDALYRAYKKALPAPDHGIIPRWRTWSSTPNGTPLLGCLISPWVNVRIAANSCGSNPWTNGSREGRMAGSRF